MEHALYLGYENRQLKRVLFALGDILMSMDKPLVLLYEYQWEDSGVHELPHLKGKVVSHTSIADGSSVLIPYVYRDFDGCWCSTRHRYLVFKTYEDLMAYRNRESENTLYF